MASTLARQGIGPVLGHTQLADLAAALWLLVLGSTFCISVQSALLSCWSACSSEHQEDVSIGRKRNIMVLGLRSHGLADAPSTMPHTQCVPYAHY